VSSFHRMMQHVRNRSVPLFIGVCVLCVTNCVMTRLSRASDCSFGLHTALAVFMARIHCMMAAATTSNRAAAAAYESRCCAVSMCFVLLVSHLEQQMHGCTYAWTRMRALGYFVLACVLVSFALAQNQSEGLLCTAALATCACAGIGMLNSLSTAAV
jgi:hypothetical protein